MLNRFSTAAALFLISLPLVACGGGDDDSSGKTSLAGHTYALTIQKGDWAMPRGVGADLYPVAPVFLFDVQGSDASLSTTLGYGAATTYDANKEVVAIPPSAVTQDACGPTTTTTFAATDKTISIPPMRMHVVNSAVDPHLQVTADVFNLTFTDVMPSGGTTSTTGKMQATMDFKQLYILFASLGATRTPASVCQALSDHYTPASCMDDSCKVKCEMCPNAAAGDDATCLTVQATDLGAVLADNIKVSPITSVDPTACADSTITQ